MQQLARYDDVVAALADELTTALDRLVSAGVREEQVVLDPGLGFAKDADHNLTLLAELPSLLALDRPVSERDDATQAVTSVVAWQGAWGVRVHDVRPAADAVRVVAAIQAAGT
jgi:dihydropteroate synthase